jgi:hypothetical protein
MRHVAQEAVALLGKLEQSQAQPLELASSPGTAARSDDAA